MQHFITLLSSCVAQSINWPWEATVLPAVFQYCVPLVSRDLPAPSTSSCWCWPTFAMTSWSCRSRCSGAGTVSPWTTRLRPAESPVVVNGDRGTRRGITQHLTLGVSGIAPSKGNKLPKEKEMFRRKLSMYTHCPATRKSFKILALLPAAWLASPFFYMSLFTSKITEADCFWEHCSIGYCSNAKQMACYEVASALWNVFEQNGQMTAVPGRLQYTLWCR